MPVTFGELTALAEDHLRFASRQDFANASEAELIGVICAFAACISRVADLIATPRHRPRDTDPNPAWRQSGATVADQLTRARQLVAGTVAGLSPRHRDFHTPAAAHLLSGRTAIGASQDLLATHIDLTRTGPAYRTPTAPIIDSPAARRQLTVVASTYASYLAPLAAQLSAEIESANPTLADPLLTVAGHLATAAAATNFVRHHDYEQRALVGEVPAVEPLRRCPRQPEESPWQLLGQALASAQRLQLIAFRDLREDIPSHHSAGTLAAVAAAVVSSLEAQQKLLQGLVEDVQLAGNQETNWQIDAVNAAIDDTRLAASRWGRIRHQWVEVRGLPPSLGDQAVRREADDLAIRLSSLAEIQRQLRAAAEGFSRANSSPTVLDDPQRCLTDLTRLRALQQEIAVSHSRLTEALARTGQLLVPTRTLTEEDDVPRPWAPISSERASNLANAYTDPQVPIITRGPSHRSPALSQTVNSTGADCSCESLRSGRTLGGETNLDLL